jgi:spermidine synthase
VLPVLLALLSGAPALAYQVVWTRLVALSAGSQVEAISVVLVAFFGGLALGARLLGGRADRVASPLRLYGLLEVGAGALAAATLLPLGALAGGETGLASGWGLLLAAGCLLPATILLGGTLPALLRTRAGNPAQGAGWILGANTLGSVTGVGLAVWAIPALGLRATLAWAAAGSAAVGLAALVAARLAALAGRTGRAVACRAGAGGSEAGAVSAAAPLTFATPLGLALGAAAAAGAATMAFETLAARMFALRLGSSLLAWAVVLALFLIGLAAGNLAFAGIAARSRRPVLLLGWIEAAAAVALAAGSALLSHSPALPAEGLVPRALLALVIGVAPAATLMGGAFPFFVRLAVRGEGVGRAFGRASAWNTTGGMAGALLAPFVLLPVLGPATAVLFCAGVNALLAMLLLMAGSEGAGSGLIRAGLVCAGVGLVAARPPLDPVPLGPARVLFVAHGRQATAVVAQVAGRRDLLVDGDPEASTDGEARRTEELLAMLPLLLHPAPGRFLELGLGSGITLATAARFPLVEIDCVEIADSVIRASAFFAPDNALDGAAGRVRILPGDARVFLARHPRAYDVVVANTLHPWSVGATGLYSTEYFARLARALRPGGIAAQWLPVERIGAESLTAILRSFFGAFPDGALWWGAENLIALGSDAPIATPDESVLRVRLAATRLEPDQASAVDPGELRASRIASAAAVRAALGPGAILSDDRPVLEARGPEEERGNGAVQRLLARIADAAVGEPGSSPAARVWLQSLATRAGGDASRAAALEAQAAAGGLASLVARARARPLVEAGYRALAEQRFDAAARAFREALRLDPNHRDARFGLVGVAQLRGQRDEAIAELRALLDRFPDDAAANNELSAALDRKGDPEGARRAAQRALEANPFYPEALANAGLLAAAAGDLEAAGQMLTRLRAVTPLGTSAEEQALSRALGTAADGRREGHPPAP